MLRDLFLELTYPFRTLAVMPTIIVFTIIFGFVIAGFSMGPVTTMVSFFVIVIILPPIFRYFLHYLEGRARDREPEVLDAQNFSWAGSLWSAFPIAPMLGIAALVYYLGKAGQETLIDLVLLASVAVLPASFAVLAITHSPLQSLNPLAIVRFLGRSWSRYWLSPLSFVGGWFLLDSLPALPGMVEVFIGFVLLTICFGITGLAVRNADIVDDVYLSSVDDLDDEEVEQRLTDKQRENVLGTAYGFASRNNVEGALKHITGSLVDDQSSAWDWYFERMLKWEDSFPAMKFAQAYIGILINEDRYREVNKLVMRCRLIDERFKPLPEHRDVVLEILRQSGNEELANALLR